MAGTSVVRCDGSCDFRAAPCNASPAFRLGNGGAENDSESLELLAHNTAVQVQCLGDDGRYLGCRKRQS
jgi:hypothetical protein